LIVTKVTVPSTDTSTPFPITATGGASITAPASRTLTGNGSSTDYEVTPGSYTVTENVPAGWDQTGFCQSIPVGAGDTVNCTITNTKRGHLIVTKVTVPSTDTSTPFPITATGGASITAPASRTLTGNGSSTDYEVTPGTYTVNENVPAGWDQTGFCQNVSVGAGDTVNCTITNSKRGHLIVTKVTNPATDTSTPFPITATGGGSITAPASRTLTGNGSSTDYEVTSGTYTVTENVPAGWDQTGVCQNVSVGAGETVNCTITNTLKGHLIVTKVTEPSTDTTSQFQVNATGTGAITAPAARTLTGNGGSTNYEVAGNRTYSVAETVPSGWSQVSNSCQNVLVPPGQTVNCQITNTEFGHIVVTKIVINDNGGIANSSSFTMAVTGNSASPASFPGGSGTIVNVIAGSYSVTESGPSGYAASFSTDCGGTVAAGETKTCTITNNDIQPKLIVTKIVINDNGGTATSSSFTLNVTGNGASPSSFAGNFLGTTVNLNAGSYSVTESAQTNYAASFSPGCSGTIAVGETKTCTVTNNDIRPTLLVIKQVVNNYGRTATPSDFTMNVMNNSINVASFPGGPGTPVGMNAGIYAVTETGAPGYQASFSADCSGTIGIGQTKTCVITNTALPTGLITDSGLCKYDVDTSTPTTEQFKLLLTPDVDHPGQYKLNASNPGQFYYNVFGATGTSYITLPYPFVTHGAVPIHVYSGVTFTTVNGQTCLTPGTELANSVTPVTLANYSPQQFGSTYELNIPAGAYVNIHLDYGLKGTSPYSKGANNSAVRTGYPTILDGQPYPFSFYDGSTHTQTTYSVNVFKKDPGIAGLVLSSSTSNPVPGVTVEIYDPSNVLVQTLTTDVDGWFMWQFKYTGKATTFTVKLPAYNLSQPVTLKSNDFAVVNFLIP